MRSALRERLHSPLLAAAAALWVLLACRSFPRPSQPFTDARQALDFHRLARERVQSIRAEARVDQRGREGRIKGTVLMFVERPAHVRIDAMTQFGPAAILTSDGEVFAYTDLRKRRFTTGPTCPQNIARLINIPFDIEDTTVLLLGGTPVIENSATRIEWVEEGYYRVQITGKGGYRQEVDFRIRERDAKVPPSRQDLRLSRSEIYDPKGRTQWRVSYDDYRPVPLGTLQIAMPFEVRVEQPRDGSDTLIRFKQIDFSAGAPPEAFVQVPAPGLEQEVLTCD